MKNMQMSQTNHEIKHEISCDIIRDLFPSYLDGICSEASAKLIEEHLKDCRECSRILLSMKTAVPEAVEISDKKASALVRLKKFIGLNKLASGVLLLVSVGLCLFFLNWQIRVTPTLYYYLLPTVLLGSYLILGTAPASVCGFRCSPLLCAAGFLTIPCGVLAALSVYLWIRRGVFLHIPVQECGPCINAVLLALIAVNCALLAVLLWKHARESVLSLPMLAGNVTGILLLLSYRYMLYCMATPEQYIQDLLVHTCVLLAEGAAFYLLVCLKKHFFDTRSLTDYNK